MRGIQLKVGIIGGGAIGLLISAYLASEHSITIYTKREEQKQIINKQGIHLKEITSTKGVNASILSELQNEDCFIVCVKQSNITSVLPFIKQIDEKTPVIFLQNGMGHIDEVSRLTQPVILGVVEHGALKINDSTVSHTGRGRIYLAPYEKKSNERTKKLANTLNQSDFPIESKEEWHPLLMDKLIINAVINPITSLFGVKNKEVVNNSRISYLAKKICQESASVLQMDPTASWERVQKVALSTSENTSSMLKDIQESRKTEIEGITGYIIHNKKSKELPYSTFIYYSIKAIEEMKGIKEE